MHLLSPFVLCTNFSLFHISHLDTCVSPNPKHHHENKSKNKDTFLSFYTAKLKKVKSSNIRKEMVKRVIFAKLWDIAKCI